MKTIIKSVIIVLLFAIGMGLNHSVMAKDVYDLSSVKDIVKRSDLNFDEKLKLQTSEQYLVPKSIGIIEVDTSDYYLRSDSKKWIDNLYYYLITRKNLPDMPFAFIVDSNGTVYDMRQSTNIFGAIKVGDESTILIAYLSDRSELSNNVINTLGKLISQISYTVGIDKTDTQFGTLGISKSGGNKDPLTKLHILNVDTDKLQIEKRKYTILQSATFSTKPHLDYELSVNNVNYPTEAKAGEQVTVSISVKNVGTVPLNTAELPVYISTINTKKSKFLVEDEWDSFTKPTHIENSVLMPNDSVTVSFKLQMPLLPTKISEEFQLVTMDGVKFDNTSFTVSIEVKKGEFKLLQIKDTETGKLNVRSCDSLGCKVIGSVDVGAIFKYSAKQNAWYKIEYKRGEYGWVWGKYIKVLQ